MRSGNSQQRFLYRYDESRKSHTSDERLGVYAANDSEALHCADSIVTLHINFLRSNKEMHFLLSLIPSCSFTLIYWLNTQRRHESMRAYIQSMVNE